jgi:hypothetical protein
MFPKGILKNNKVNRLIVFEEDINNPANEGFICFWEIKHSEKKQLIFKKRLSNTNAQRKWETLIKKGWEIHFDKDLAA